MTAQTSNDDIKEWAESLRDQVSRISGRKKGGVPGFNAELKGELLDAIDLLVEQASDEDAEDPIALAIESIRNELVAHHEQEQTRFREHSEAYIQDTLSPQLKHQIDNAWKPLSAAHAEISSASMEALESLRAHLAERTSSLEEVQSLVRESSEQAKLWQTDLNEQTLSSSMQLQELRTTIESLSEKLEAPRDNGELQDQVSDLNERLNQAIDLERELRSELAEVRQEWSEDSAKCRELEVQIASLDAQCKSLQEQCAKLQERLIHAERAEAEQRAQLEIVRDKKARVEQENSDLQAEMSELKARCDTLKEQQLDSEQTSQALERENEVLQSKVAAAEEVNTGPVESNMDLGLIEATEAKCQELGDQILDFEKRNRELQAECDALSEQLRQIERNAEDQDQVERQGMEQQNAELQAEIENIKLQREEAELAKLQLEEECEALRKKSAGSRPVEELHELETEVERLHGELAEANKLLEEAIADGKDENSEENNASEELTELLKEAREEIVVLQNQNSDLAAQVARQQVLTSSSKAHQACDEENLTWEDRKRLIMLQLAEEEGDADEARRLEIEQILASTEKALEQKTKEIDELKGQLEAQGEPIPNSEVDQDEVIQREREKLRKIQREWEDKLREAEIDLSKERAQLARQRSELEQGLLGSKKSAKHKEGGRTRKWLDHLGLREDAGK